MILSEDSSSDLFGLICGKEIGRGMANRPESVSQMVETKLRLREERFVIAREYFLWIFMMACKRLQPSC